MPKKRSLYDATCLLPGLEPSYFDAIDYADQTSFFESRNILIDKENYIYPPLETFTKSFEKWLALQKHDVEAVNSLHEWLKAVEIARIELADEIYDLEQMELSPALQTHVDKAISRKENEYRQLRQLRFDLDEAKDRVRKNKCNQRRIKVA